MTTPTVPTLVPPPSPRAPEAYPEHDKLGPLATRAPGPVSFDDGAAVRAHVLAAVHDALEPARVARTRIATDPGGSVHEVRKAIRRTRAIVDLVASALPRRERRDIRDALREARRTLGPSRDLTVASKLLLAIADDDQAAGAAAIAAAAQADEISAKMLGRGLAATYRQARDARRKAKRSDRAVHRWRRRNKELGYQLALLAEVPAAAELREALTTLDDALGEVVDRLLLTEFVGLYGASDPSAGAALLTRIHDELDDRRDQARRASRELYAVRPRKLRRRLRRAMAPVPVDDRAPEPAAAPAGT
ncbi:MAG TPA: CHAD domain-containing protein [Kofleriaceae bacterium]|nr:CHAD domain-containing protein [Kofleriaceae bacterium]